MLGQKTLALAIGVISCLGGTSHVMAAAFQLNYQSTNAIALANAGRATLTDNASVIYTNPAGLSRLDGHQASANISGIFPSTDISQATTSTHTGSAQGDAVSNTALASAFWAIPATGDALSAGVGFYQPFGFNANYEDSYVGRYWGDQSELTILTLQPTISYSPSKQLSIGAGLTVNYIDGKLNRRMLAQYEAATNTSLNASQSLEGNDIAYGWNLGAMYDITDQLRIGAVYRSEVDYKVEGHINFDGIPTALAGALQLPFSSGRYNTQLNLNTPESYELSASYAVAPSTTLHGSWMRTNWSSLQQLPIRIDGTAIGSLSTSEALNYRDTDFYSMGISWQQTEQLGLRAGIAHDEAVANTHASARVPTGTRMLYTLGADYQISTNTSVNLAYIYAQEDSTQVTANNADSGRFDARLENAAHIVSAQLNYRF